MQETRQQQKAEAEVAGTWERVHRINFEFSSIGKFKFQILNTITNFILSLCTPLWHQHSAGTFD